MVARLVVLRGKGPVPVGDPPVYVCACGLSRAFPYCTGAHIGVQDEGEDGVYVYGRDASRLGRVDSLVLEDGRRVEPGEVYEPPGQG